MTRVELPGRVSASGALLEGPHTVDSRAKELPNAYLRLGELYEERGDRAAAVKRYRKFIERWATADEPLAAKVREVAERAERLRRTGG